MAIKRQTIVDRLITVLSLINGTGSYNNNFTNKVFEYKKNEWKEADIPGISVEDSSQDSVEEQSTAYGIYVYDLNVTLRAYCQGTTTLVTLRKIISDVQRTLKTDLNLNGNLMDLKWVSDEFQLEHKEKLTGSVQINLKLRYSTDAFSDS